MEYRFLESPLGRILLAGRGDTLFRVHFQEGARPLEIPEAWTHSPECFAEAVRQLSAYFAGRLFSFDLDVAPDGAELDFSGRCRRNWRKFPAERRRPAEKSPGGLYDPGPAGRWAGPTAGFPCPW